MTKVAIPLFNSRVSPRFGYAAEILIADIEGDRVTKRRKLDAAGMPPQQLAAVLAAQGVATVICSGISGFSADMIAARGMNVFPGVIGEAEEALAAYAAGKLEPGAICGGRCKGKRNRRGPSGPPWCRRR